MLHSVAWLRIDRLRFLPTLSSNATNVISIERCCTKIWNYRSNNDFVSYKSFSSLPLR